MKPRAQPIFLSDGPYRTHIVQTASLRETWWWCVTHQASKAQRSGHATSEAYARHEARKALGELRADDTEAAA